MRIRPSIVSRGYDGFLKPGNGLIPFLLFNQVSPDIVVRIAKIRINFDGLQAFGDGAIVVAEEGVRPAAKGVCLRGGVGLDRASVELDGPLIVALHLKLV